MSITLTQPLIIRHNEEDQTVIFFYKEFKQMDHSERYLLVQLNI